jgi:hypothetical protein
MNWLVYHIVSGHSFFTGVALLVLAAFASTRSRPIFSRITVLSFLIGITLIPKRVFLSVIAGDDSTLDSIHLSQSGHQTMADTVWRSVVSAFDGVM